MSKMKPTTKILIIQWMFILIEITSFFILPDEVEYIGWICLVFTLACLPVYFYVERKE